MRCWLGYGLLAALLVGCGSSDKPAQQPKPLPPRLIPQLKDQEPLPPPKNAKQKDAKQKDAKSKDTKLKR